MNSTPTPLTGTAEASRSTHVTERRVESEPLRVIQVERISISEEQRYANRAAPRQAVQGGGDSNASQAEALPFQVEALSRNAESLCHRLHFAMMLAERRFDHRAFDA